MTSKDITKSAVSAAEVLAHLSESEVRKAAQRVLGRAIEAGHIGGAGVGEVLVKWEAAACCLGDERAETLVTNLCREVREALARSLAPAPAPAGLRAGVEALEKEFRALGTDGPKYQKALGAALDFERYAEAADLRTVALTYEDAADRLTALLDETGGAQ